MSNEKRCCILVVSLVAQPHSERGWCGEGPASGSPTSLLPSLMHCPLSVEGEGLQGTCRVLEKVVQHFSVTRIYTDAWLYVLDIHAYVCVWPSMHKSAYEFRHVLILATFPKANKEYIYSQYDLLCSPKPAVTKQTKNNISKMLQQSLNHTFFFRPQWWISGRRDASPRINLNCGFS